MIQPLKLYGNHEGEKEGIEFPKINPKFDMNVGNKFFF